MDPLPRKKMHIVNFVNNLRGITHLLKPKLKDLTLGNSIGKFLIQLIKLITSYWLKISGITVTWWPRLAKYDIATSLLDITT